MRLGCRAVRFCRTSFFFILAFCLSRYIGKIYSSSSIFILRHYNCQYWIYSKKYLFMDKILRGMNDWVTNELTCAWHHSLGNFLVMLLSNCQNLGIVLIRDCMIGPHCKWYVLPCNALRRSHVVLENETFNDDWNSDSTFSRAFTNPLPDIRCTK